MSESSKTSQTESSGLSHLGPAARKRSPMGIFAGMRIRKKLIVLHTAFSISLGVVLLLAIRPAMSKVLFGAEYDQSEQIITLMLDDPTKSIEQLPDLSSEHVKVVVGLEATREFSDAIAYQSRQNPDIAIPVPSDGFSTGVVRWLPETDTFVLVRARSNHAKKTIQLVYVLVIVTLIAGYGLVAAALEVFVLPEYVYRPISEILNADAAVREGIKSAEIIPENLIPADELGSIMRSRNDSIHALRLHERDLARALEHLEHTAADLHKKNHLLETARKNLEGADRLASLGMMSAGIAHELNTPLAVVKGLVDKLNNNKELSDTEITLLARVVGRLEKLSDGLLDFARVRPPSAVDSDIHTLMEEAKTLVLLERKEKMQTHGVQIRNDIKPGTIISCDPNRMVQVFLNLVRNAVDALFNSKQTDGLIELISELEMREGEPWINIRVQDNGPGIESEIIDRLFEPFVSSRLDSHGTGLGLAVTNGIVREHGGVLIATNRPADDAQSGAIFELFLPTHQPETGC